MKTALNTLKGKSPKPTAPFNTITEPTALPLHSEHEFSDIPPSVNERASKPVTRTRDEKTQGWMGEWNQEDMADVIRKLRALK
jgi:hypothetical protein